MDDPLLQSILSPLSLPATQSSVPTRPEQSRIVFSHFMLKPLSASLRPLVIFPGMALPSNSWFPSSSWQNTLGSNWLLGSQMGNHRPSLPSGFSRYISARPLIGELLARSPTGYLVYPKNCCPSGAESGFGTLVMASPTCVQVSTQSQVLRRQDPKVPFPISRLNT